MRSQTTARIVGERYRLGGVLGQGGMARVYDAYDERLERAVAVKILHPATEALPGMRQRFAREAHIAARLIHPYIVAVLDYGEDEDACYLVMERLPGTTLGDEMSRGPVPTRRVVMVTLEILTALEAAHRHGVLHRDIKPGNILHQDDGHTKITDFGIAKSLDLPALVDSVPDDATQAGMVLGTPGYLAPERCVGAPASVRTDVYAVGAVMVEALTGTRPGRGSGLGAVPTSLRAVAARAVAPDPAARFASAEQMLLALRALQRDGPSLPLIVTTSAPVPIRPPPVIPAPPPPPEDVPSPTGAWPVPARPPPARPAPPPAARRRQRRWRAALTTGGFVLATALGLAAAFVLWAGPHPTQRATPPAAHRTIRTVSHPSDPVAAELRAAATAIAADAQAGDPVMAQALDEAAAQPAGASRVAAAEEALALAHVLGVRGAITASDYEDAVTALAATGASGASVPRNPTPTTPSLFPPSPPTGRTHDYGSHHGFGIGGFRG